MNPIDMTQLGWSKRLSESVSDYVRERPSYWRHKKVVVFGVVQNKVENPQAPLCRGEGRGGIIGHFQIQFLFQLSFLND